MGIHLPNVADVREGVQCVLYLGELVCQKSLC